MYPLQLMNIELFWMKQISTRSKANQWWWMCFDYRLCASKYAFNFKFQLPLPSYLMNSEVQIDKCWIKCRSEIVPVNDAYSEINYFHSFYLFIYFLLAQEMANIYPATSTSSPIIIRSDPYSDKWSMTLSAGRTTAITRRCPLFITVVEQLWQHSDILLKAHIFPSRLL